jgi:hypothetical protein
MVLKAVDQIVGRHDATGEKMTSHPLAAIRD